MSELEGVVLGIVNAQQPCTAYAVRKEIASSPSSHWSASAGAIYPLLRRLEAGGLLSVQADPEDGRGRRLITLTRAGRRALREWMLEVGQPDVAANLTDALRSRAFFLAALRPAERRRFVKEALEAAEEFMEVARQYAEARDDSEPYAGLAARGALHAAEARVRWLRDVQAAVEGAVS